MGWFQRWLMNRTNRTLPFPVFDGLAQSSDGRCACHRTLSVTQRRRFPSWAILGLTWANGGPGNPRNNSYDSISGIYSGVVYQFASTVGSGTVFARSCRR